MNASSFNKPIGNWDVSSAFSFYQMFRNASSFNQDIGDWNTSNVNNTRHTFNGASSFNYDISNWDLNLVTDMTSMFDSTDSLSNSHKGKIHESFTSNANWPYDWREFVATLDDSNFHTAVNLWFDNDC